MGIPLRLSLLVSLLLGSHAAWLSPDSKFSSRGLVRSLNSGGTCNYEETTLTEDLVAGSTFRVVGKVSVAIKTDGGLDVTYSLSEEGCTFTDSAHVELVNAELTKLSPGQFGCKKASPSGSTDMSLHCPPSNFDAGCCGDLFIYTHAVIQCGGDGGESDTVFAGAPGNECPRNKKGQSRWCRYFKVSRKWSRVLQGPAATHLKLTGLCLFTTFLFSFQRLRRSMHHVGTAAATREMMFASRRLSALTAGN